MYKTLREQLYGCNVIKFRSCLGLNWTQHIANAFMYVYSRQTANDKWQDEEKMFICWTRSDKTERGCVQDYRVAKKIWTKTKRKTPTHLYGHTVSRHWPVSRWAFKCYNGQIVWKAIIFWDSRSTVSTNKREQIQWSSDRYSYMSRETTIELSAYHPCYKTSTGLGSRFVLLWRTESEII